MKPTKAQLKQWRETYKKKNIKQWRFFNNCRNIRRRAKKMLADTGKVTKAFLYKLYNCTVCFYCDKKTPKAKRTIEHIVPLIKGGKHHPKNLVMACKSCNFSKQAKDLEAFLKLKRTKKP